MVNNVSYSSFMMPIIFVRGEHEVEKFTALGPGQELKWAFVCLFYCNWTYSSVEILSRS